MKVVGVSAIIKEILTIFIRFIYFIFGRIHAGETAPFIIGKIHACIYNLWMNQRFNTSECYFSYPQNFRKGQQFFHIGRRTVFHCYCTLTAWKEYDGIIYSPEVCIGEDCQFGQWLNITCINRIIIGNNVLTGRWVTISDNSHGRSEYKSLLQPPSKRPLFSKGPIVISDNVWIGDKATILSGVKIGEGAIIGANSVVTKDIPPFSVAAGCPAVVIKRLNH